MERCVMTPKDGWERHYRATSFTNNKKYLFKKKLKSFTQRKRRKVNTIRNSQDPVGFKIALGLGLKRQSISRWRTVKRSIAAALQMKQTTLKIGRWSSAVFCFFWILSLLRKIFNFFSTDSRCIVFNFTISVIFCTLYKFAAMSCQRSRVKLSVA